MANDQLWAPWRLAYIENSAPDVSAKNEQDCFLCRYIDQSADEENLVVMRSELSLVVLNRFPYNNGHLLVAPLEHKSELSDLSEAEQLDLQKLISRMIRAESNFLKPDGFNIGLNLGRVAGAGLPGHLHWHIVPRWNGDTNFMPVLTDTKVIPQSLHALYELLQAQLSD